MSVPASTAALPTLVGLQETFESATQVDVPVPYQRPDPPSLDDAARYYRLAVEAGHYSNGGPCVQMLGERTAARIGDVESIPVANCTIGLMAALRAAFGDPAPERRSVIVPSFTFTATACAIVWAGFEPLFVDVDRDAWQLDAGALARVLGEHGERVAGVLGCSTFGTPAPAATRAAWRRLCADAGVPLVIDSAAAFGAADDAGLPAGADGETHVFSFHVTKPFAVAEGGIVTTGDPEVADRLRSLINFGFDETRTSLVAGLNGKMSELHAAMALAMLDRYDNALRRRRAQVAAISSAMSDLPLRRQLGAEGSTWQVLQVLVPDADARARALQAAERLGVEARACFDPPLHEHPAFADYPTAGDLPNTRWIADRSLSLPMADSLTSDERRRIEGAVRAGLTG
jgi:dTDP-4-amino-4,6-dideoxygalactose transaminase